MSISTEGTKVNQTRYRGDTVQFRVEVVDYDSDTRVETPVDITGYEFWLTVKNELTDADPGVFQVSKSTGHTDPTNGITILTIPKTATVGMEGRYHYDVQMEDTNGNVTTLFSGTLTILADVTRAIS